jgi:hypothetical protein
MTLYERALRERHDAIYELALQHYGTFPVRVACGIDQSLEDITIN